MTYSLLESFRSHVKAGRLSEALSRFMDLPKVRSRDESKEREVVHAELLQLTGSNEEARDVANGLLRTAVSEALQARCQLVLGQVCLEKEAPSHSVRYFQKAARLAHDAQEMQLVCHAQAKLLTVLADISPRNSILGLMREAEQNVANYGTAQVNADFYTRVAQIEATAGSFACAVKHIDTAETFLEVDPNLWLEGSTCLAASAVYFLASDLDVATQYATRALALGVKSGHARIEMAAKANLGLLHLHGGRLEEADNLITESLRVAGRFSVSQISLLDSYAQLELVWP